MDSSRDDLVPRHPRPVQHRRRAAARDVPRPAGHREPLRDQHLRQVSSPAPSWPGATQVELIDTAGDRSQLLRELLRCDLLCFGGGSIIKELYASTGRNRYSTLLMILAIVTFARRVARKPIAMLNVGVGPITTPERAPAGQADPVPGRPARRARRQVVRDLPGGRPAPRPGRTRPPTPCSPTGPDWLLAGPARRRARRTRPGRPPGRHARSRRRPAAPGGAQPQLPHREPRQLGALPRPAGRRADRFARGASDRAARPADAGRASRPTTTRRSSTAFAERRAGHHDASSTAPTTHGDVARLIAGCDLLVSERLHAIVIAAILGVPAFVLAYDVKVLELAAMLDLESSTIDINQPFEAAEVTDRLADLVERRAERLATPCSSAALPWAPRPTPASTPPAPGSSRRPDADRASAVRSCSRGCSRPEAARPCGSIRPATGPPDAPARDQAVTVQLGSLK